MTDDDELRLLNVLTSLHTGNLTAAMSVESQSDVDDWGAFCGDLTYALSNGWTITIFDDCNSFDYIDNVVTAQGQIFDFDDLWFLAETKEGAITPRKDGKNRARNYRGCLCDLRPELTHSKKDCDGETFRVWGIPV